jgi:hypothetical protein
MQKKKSSDFGAISDIYSNILDQVVVVEETANATQEIGSADLKDEGGPENVEGFESPVVDKKVKGSSSDSNAYNIDNLSYDEDAEEVSVKQEVLNVCKQRAVKALGGSVGVTSTAGMALGCKAASEEYKNSGDTEKEEIASNLFRHFDKQDKAGFQRSPYKAEDAEENIDLMNAFDKGTDPEGKDTDEDKLIDKKLFDDDEEEDEESSEITEKIAQDSLNNFMKRKSQFDKLFESVMYGDEEGAGDVSAELDALGVDDEGVDTEGESDIVTLELDRETAQTLCDLLKGTLDCGEDDLGMDDDAEAGFEGDFEEDEEGISTKTSGNESYDDGKHNKVGNSDVKPTAGSASSDVTDSVTLDGGKPKDPDHAHKNNKVGTLKKGKSMFGQ